MDPPPDLTNASDQRIVELVRADDQAACRELLRRYQGPVYTFIRHRIGDRETAKDLTQETLARVFRAILRHPPKRRLSTWILGIAKHVAADYLRRKELTPLPLDDGPDVTPPTRKTRSTALRVESEMDITPEPRVRARKLAPAIERAVEQLRPTYRECFKLRYVEERSYEDIAELLDLPVGTVASYIHRARARTLVALELARIVYEMLTKQEDFNGRFKGRPLSRRKHARWPRRASPSVSLIPTRGHALDGEARRCANEVSGTASVRGDRSASAVLRGRVHNGVWSPPRVTVNLIRPADAARKRRA